MLSNFSLETNYIYSYASHAYLASIVGRYNQVSSDLRLNSEKVGEFVERLREDFQPEQISDTYKLNSKFTVVSDKVVISISHSMALVMTKGPSIAEVIKEYQCYFANYEDPSKVWVYCFYMQNDELQGQSIPVRKTDFGVVYPEFYPDIEVNELIEQYTRSPEKILILFGRPGTGKTTFIKHMLASGAYEKIAYCKDLQAMQSDAYWIDMQMNGYDLIILDDLDANLAPRDRDSNQLVSKMLSFSDGVLVSKSKIIITTNQEVQYIDPAIVRPGRCFDIVELDTLSIENAQKVWTGVLGNESKTFPTVDGNKISQAALMMAHIRQADLGRSRTYLKDAVIRDMSVEDKIHKLGIKTERARTGFNSNREYE